MSNVMGVSHKGLKTLHELRTLDIHTFRQLRIGLSTDACERVALAEGSFDTSFALAMAKLSIPHGIMPFCKSTALERGTAFTLCQRKTHFEAEGSKMTCTIEHRAAISESNSQLAYR